VAKEGGAVAAETLAAAEIIMSGKANRIAAPAKPVDVVRMALPLVSRDHCRDRGRNEERSDEAPYLSGHRPWERI
jgi:hypothetical protein